MTIIAGVAYTLRALLYWQPSLCCSFGRPCSLPGWMRDAASDVWRPRQQHVAQFNGAARKIPSAMRLAHGRMCAWLEEADSGHAGSSRPQDVLHVPQLLLHPVAAALLLDLF